MTSSKAPNNGSAKGTRERSGSTQHLSPAEYVIHKFGGVRKTAEAIGRDPTAISKWRQPKNKRGTGGDIPTKAQRLILKAAEKLKLDITAEDLIHGRKVPTRLVEVLA